MDQQQQHQQQCPSTRPSRLEKQEEFEEEEDTTIYMPSPVTIQIEDRGSGPDDGSDGSGGECGTNGSKLEYSDGAVGDKLDTSERTDVGDECRTERGKMPSQRVKLLVRSQAVHDDSSPPPDLETVITNTNMLSVTNAPAFATQTQSKSSNKNRLGRQSSSQGSQGSTESSSGLSRDSSTEYTDSTGIDLQQFIIDTLHKNQKDRIMLLKIEQDLISLVKDPKRHSWKFAQMSSYNRMLVHRVAAFFGLDHYVDANGTSVIVNKTKNTRIPDARFQDHFRDELLPEEPKKSILKRDSISFEEGKEHKSPERQSSTDSRRSKSFEEREEEYEKARARIFNQDEGLGESPISRRSSQEDIRWPSSDTRPWSSTDSDSSGRPLGAKAGSSFETEGAQAPVSKGDRSVAVLNKAESEGKEFHYQTRLVRPVMTKASSFGGISVLTREGSERKNITPKITKAESFNVTTLSSSGVSVCGTMPSQIQMPTTPSPSSIAMQTSCQSQYIPANAQQTFPMVAGHPTHLHIPLQQFSSQISGWPVVNREVSVSDYSGQATVGQQYPMWPVSSATDNVFPSGVVVNQQSGGSPYVNMDNVVYRYKVPSNASGQTIMLTPYQPVAIQPQTQVPISSHVSAVSQPTQQQQPPPAVVHQATPTNLQASMNPQQPQQQTIQIQQQPTVVYVPYITSQISSAVAQQPALGCTAVQQIQQPPPPPPPPPPSQIQPAHPQQLLTEQRTYAVNPNSGSVEEVATQISGLSLLTSHAPQQQDLSGGRNLNVDPSSSPQSYVVPNFKTQGSAPPQGNINSYPVYYLQQVQQASNIHPIRYVFPASTPVAHQVPQSVSNSGQLLADVQSHIVTQSSSQMTGPQYLPGYPVLALSQHGDTAATNTYVSYTLASQTTAVTTTTSVLVPSSPLSMPIYPYGSMMVGNISQNTDQPSFSPPVTTQPTHTPTYVQTPMAIQTPTALPMYVLATTTAQAPLSQSQVNTSPFAAFRSQSLPSAPSTVGTTAILNPQLSSNSTAVGYAVYAAQHLPSGTPQTTVITPSSQNSSPVMAPAILTTFQVLRPNVPLVRTIRASSSPPITQNVITHYSSQPTSSNKTPLSFPLVKQASDPGVDCYGLGNGRAEQSKGSRSGKHQTFATSGLARPGSSSLVCQRVPVMQDLCLLGHPLQHHSFNPLMFPQPRPLARFMHPQSGTGGTNRPPKNRGKRNKNQAAGGATNGSRNGTSLLPHPDINGGNVLQVDGLPEGFKRSEIERYLDQAVCLGAKIQIWDTETGSLLTSETDFIVCSRHLVVAVFESETAAQSALLGIKTPKFQLRPMRPGTKDISQKKYS